MFIKGLVHPSIIFTLKGDRKPEGGTIVMLSHSFILMRPLAQSFCRAKSSTSSDWPVKINDREHVGSVFNGNSKEILSQLHRVTLVF